MKKLLIAALAATAFALPTSAEPLVDNQYKTMHSLGCMLLGECTDDVEPIWGIDYLAQEYPESNWNPVAEEFQRILNALTMIDVQVYLADGKYFPVGHRGVYHTVSNNFFLNRIYMDDPAALMMVMRHEGWHAAQDCMAGTIDNSMIAIIKPEDEVPMIWRVMAERTYPKSAVPWEAEAGWAGRTENMTMEALEACERGRMWEVYPPTPMTNEWLVENGYK
jgi:hypothetical protein